MWESPFLCQYGRADKRASPLHCKKWNSLQGWQVHYADDTAGHHFTAGGL